MAPAEQLEQHRTRVSVAEEASRERLREGTEAARRVTLIVENMNCGACMNHIERVLSAAPGVAAVRANLSAKRVTVEADSDCDRARQLIDLLIEKGYNAAEFFDAKGQASERHDRELLKRVAVAGFAAANIMLLSVSVWAGIASDMNPAVKGLFYWVSALIALPTVAYAGQPFFKSALRALRAWRLNMDVPISLAVLLATAMSLFQTLRGGDQVYFDASVTLLFFLLIGRYLDCSLRQRAKGAAQNLLALRGAWATLLDEHGKTRQVPARELVQGNVVIVTAGDRVPVDGLIRTGRSDMYESLLTGETTPRSVVVGDRVYAGTLSLSAPLQIETTASEDNTIVSEIARTVEAAEQAKGRYVRLADRAAAIYAPAVHLIGVLTFLSWLLFGAGWEYALTAAIAVLIITCPCALALAVPAVQVAAANRLFDHGIILKAADGLERLAEVDTVVFDKTGTLTLGEPRLVNGQSIDDDTLRAAGTLAAVSRHPYARAIEAAAKARDFSVAAAGHVHELPGAGLTCGQGENEQKLGSAKWCNAPEDIQDMASLWYVRSGEAPISFALEDALRSDADNVVDQLKSRGFAIELLSGDRVRKVEQAAQATGIDNWRAEQSPCDKIAHINALEITGRKVLMVGDGLNDAPALAAGHASLSPAGAAEISQMAADAIFQGAHLSPVVELLAVARRAKRLSLQNFAIAAIYNMVCIPLAVAGLVTPLIAAIAMSASSILVTLNAMRLRGISAEVTS